MRRAAAIAVFALFALRAGAQDAVLSAEEPEAEARNWGWFGDFWGGYDHVSGLPNNRVKSPVALTRIAAHAMPPATALEKGM